jgi:hypothetical protein
MRLTAHERRLVRLGRHNPFKTDRPVAPIFDNQGNRTGGGLKNPQDEEPSSGQEDSHVLNAPSTPE